MIPLQFGLIHLMQPKNTLVYIHQCIFANSIIYKTFVENLLEYVTTMVCIAVKGEPVVGVIHKPFEKKTYWAWVSQGMAEELLEINKAVIKS